MLNNYLQKLTIFNIFFTFFSSSVQLIFESGFITSLLNVISGVVFVDKIVCLK